jgi:hypothetical protein
MTEEWPSYHKGRRDHLHALGVIALSYSAFERGLISIYAHHCAQQKMPNELVQLYYSSLNEKSQLKAIRTIFDTYEKEPAVLEFVSSLINYFNWCSDARNTLLHSELYMPPQLVKPPELKLSPHPEHGIMPDHLKNRKR